MRVKNERNDKIVAHLKQSISLVKTGKAFGITDERVRQIAKAYGVLWKDLRKARAEQILNSQKDFLGVSKTLSPNDSQQIKHHLGISYKKLKEQNLRNAILECYEAGMCRMDIERFLKISYRTASKYLAEENVPAGCLRGKDAKKRDKELYLFWKKNKKSTALTGEKFAMTETNAYYCIKRHLYNNIHTKKKIK